MSRSQNAKRRGFERAAEIVAGLHRALELGTSVAAVDELLGQALDALGPLLPFDLAAILELEGPGGGDGKGDALRVRVARGDLASDAVRRHRLELARFPSVARALKSGRAVAFSDVDHAEGDGDPYDGVLDLPHGHHCMVVPLRTPAGTLGALTFDRKECGLYGSDLIKLAEIFGRLLALAMSYGEQTVALARLRDRLAEQNRVLREESDGGTSARERLESLPSAAMKRVVALARRVAAAPTPVVITGESGVGKELVARAIHEWSPRAKEPLVSVNCATLPAGLVESELFGHVKGAFSGATADRLGRFAAADGGTLFLDEVGELTLDVQAKLLRVLQEASFEPVGSDATVRVDVRVVAATNADLAQAVKEKRFREDLWYRLNVFPIGVPPLRERAEDVAVIAAQTLEEFARRRGREPWQLGRTALQRLAAQRWPGNVRELRNVLERATILATDASDELLEVELPAPAADAVRDGDESAATLEQLERRHIERTLALTGGRIYGAGGAAERLDIHPSTLRSRMEKLGLGGARDFKRQRAR
jgi:hydrogenase-4 transcriptional activator